jgi:hypothetical protein
MSGGPLGSRRAELRAEEPRDSRRGRPGDPRRAGRAAVHAQPSDHPSLSERAIRHAEVRDLVGRNVTALVKAPAGRAGRPSESLPLEQAQELLRAAGGSAPTGTAVIPHPTKDTTPLALRANVKYGVLHDRVVIVSVITENVP